MADYRDGFTQWMGVKMDEWSEKIYEIEDGISSIEDNEEEIVGYLKNVTCSNPLGLALRRYLCTKYGEGPDVNGCYGIKLSDGKTVKVSDYIRENYDINNDDIAEYVDVFLDINARYNKDSSGNMLLDFTKAEARRMLRVDTSCTREKMFLISFALHMDIDDTHKFLTDVLAEQTYNFRNPDEVIAYFCQSFEEHNSYAEYLRLKKEYEAIALNAGPLEKRQNYTAYAKKKLVEISTQEQLMEFLKENSADFEGFSQTVYDEFMLLYNKTLEKAKIQTFSNEEYLFSVTANTQEQRKAQEDRINKAIGLQAVTNTEQLAKLMLQCIPRASTERVKDGKTIVTNDFIPIYNGENGQKSKKIQTTTLPKEITMNLLMKDRLDDLIRRIKAVERKDLVFLKFFLFSLNLQEKDNLYSADDYFTFIDECNDMLVRCGMSRLYLANRFENLILLSLLSSNPFEMFENIIEYSFINEPAPEENDS